MSWLGNIMKARKWVVNASPIITLAKISRQSLLLDLSTEVVIPQEVYDEICAGPKDDPAVRWLKKDGRKWLYPSESFHKDIAPWDLGKGESAVLSYALQHPGFSAIIDDRAARNCAQSFGIPHLGTIGVILLGKKEKKLLEVKPVLDELITAGIRISTDIIEAALALAGEK